MNGSLMKDGEFNLEKLRQEFMDKKLPDDTVVSGTNVQLDTLQTEDKLSQAVQMENNRQSLDETQIGETEPRETGDPQETPQSQPGTEALIPDFSSEPEQSEASDPEEDPEQSLQQGSEGDGGSSQEADQTREPVQSGEVVAQEPEHTTYVVRKGDTLTDISIRTYGNDRYINQICNLNGIQDPDKIKVGQKIILP